MKGKIKKTKNRKKRRLIALCLIMTAVIAGILIYEYTYGLSLIGEAEESVNAGNEYIDPGVHSSLAVTEGEVDTETPGFYTIKYSLPGKTVSRKVRVIDASKIVLGLRGSGTQIVRQGEEYVECGAFAVDRRIGALNDASVLISGEVDTGTPGEYTVSYSVSSGGITKETQRIVKVVPASGYSACESVPVLMYHWVYSADDMPERINGNWIEDTLLEQEIKYLSDNGFYFPGWQELSAWIDGRISLPEKSIILTFDDGKEAFFRHGLPIFEKYEIPVTSFMICWEDNDAARKIREHASEYIDFESHSYAMHQAGHVRGHKGRMAVMDFTEIMDDLDMAEKVIGNNDAFAYPYGDYTLTGQSAVSAHGISCAFTTEYGEVQQGMDKTALPRIRIQGHMSFEAWVQTVDDTSLSGMQ